jgi:arylsulfatase A-like enzyme
LVLAGPGLANPGRRIDQLTHHIDLAPTLLALAGIDRPAEFRGGMLTKPVPDAYAEEGPWLAIHSQEQLLKLILNRQTGASEMFAMADKLDQKALEPQSRLADRERLLERARWYAGLKPLQQMFPPSESTPKSDEESSNDWSPAERKQLEALGYAQ